MRELFEARGNIAVLCRLREAPSSCLTALDDATLSLRTARADSRTFTFPRVFPVGSPQETVFDEVLFFLGSDF